MNNCKHVVDCSVSHKKEKSRMTGIFSKYIVLHLICLRYQWIVKDCEDKLEEVLQCGWTSMWVCYKDGAKKMRDRLLAPMHIQKVEKR